MVKCSCGCLAIIRMSSTPSNPGRPFYACPTKGPRNGFICWVEETDTKNMSVEAVMIAGLARSKKKLESKIWKLKMSLVLSWIIFFGIIVYKL
ncbi:uncharacterized protein LOC122194908 [Lactuca sativa]|uniref:uncharacterized protein LOC122194908 n=1 Tax=Lactuca sativa TaxID=4236 RepID=UPI001C68E80A|nr:uncharacterized protein LOC122194908 [Lactuca sativa]